MNDLVPAQFGQISNKFANVQPTDDLSSGVQSSFGMIGYKGKVWSVRFRGDEQLLLRDDGDGPRNSVEVVILKAATVVSKIWYEEGYVEGSTAPPDCFSNNGVRPEAASAKPQNELCATCPRNQWGSRITPAGKQGKDCADSKRLAVVPLEDLNNEIFGGPMLLRVPAASLQDMAIYGNKMQQWGYPYFAVGTRIAFDVNESYPKFQFNAIRPLDDDEADVVLSWQDSHIVSRILSENEFTAGVAGPEASPAHHQPVFEQQPVEQPKPAAKTTAAKANGQAKPGTLGAQVRAAAAKTAPPQAQAKVEPKAEVKKSGFGPVKEPTASQQSQSTQATTETTAAPVNKGPTAAEIAAAKKAEQIAAAKAALAALEAETSEDVEDTSQSNEDMQQDDGDAAIDSVTSDFEATLDAELSKLLPT